MGFMQQLRQRWVTSGSLVCVGLDPEPAKFPAKFSGDPDAVFAFCRDIADATAEFACAFKPQIAHFAALGAEDALERLIAHLHAAHPGVPVILDAKRGDIGSTMAGYARAWLRADSPLACDALTISPYLGVGSLDPAFDEATASGRGLFVLARTSNPEAGPLQASTGPTGTVAQSVVDEVGKRNAATGTSGPGSFGVVVGATVSDPPDLAGLRGPVLMPGVGHQGGTLDDVRRIAGPALPDTLVNISRHVLRVGPDVEAMRTAVVELAAAYRFTEVT